MVVRTFKVREFERGFTFKDRVFKGILGPGRHWFVDPLFKVRVSTMSVRAPWIKHPDLDVIVKSGALKGEARVIDLKENERALVWINGRFETILGPGLYALWTVFHTVDVEVIDARQAVRFDHRSLSVILNAKDADAWLDSHTVQAGHVALFFHDGEYRATLEPGTHAFWKGEGKVTIQPLDLRESVLDVSGQDRRQGRTALERRGDLQGGGCGPGRDPGGGLQPDSLP